MNKRFYQHHGERGFSLIELMVVVAIIGIIALVAVPSYQQQIRKANRAEAKTALATGSQSMERCFTTFISYTNSNCPTVSELSALGNGIFSYTITSINTSYTLSATASSAGQLKDTDCRTFTINNIGLRGATDSSGTANSTCW